MKRLLPIILILMLGALPLAARRQRTGPARIVPEREAAVELPDTIAVDSLSVRLSGYDKPNAATTETFFCTNLLPDSLTLSGVVVTFEYLDMAGRQLHQETHTIRCDIPPGATRRLSVPSWDRNHAFHYFRSPAPLRRQSTRYKVRSEPKKAIVWRR